MFIKNKLDILDNEAFFNLKKTYGNDLFLSINNQIDEENAISKLNKNYFSNQKYIDQELINENLRREAFDLYLKIKSLYINSSLTKKIFSPFKNSFVTFKDQQTNWQDGIFGTTKSYIIKSVNENPSQYPEISNGYLGIQSFSDEIQIQSVFSGSHLDTRRASIPSWTVRNITTIQDKDGNGIVSGRRLELDMSDAKLLQFVYSNNCLVQQKIYAHQTLKSLLIHEIEVEFLNSKLEVINIHLPKSIKNDASSNVQFRESDSKLKYLKSVVGITNQNDVNNHQQKIFATYHVIPDKIVVHYSKDVQKFYYLLSLNENETISTEHFNLGVSLMENNNKLYLNHTLAWNYIWSYSGIFMKSSDELDIPLISAQYLLMTNSPSFGRHDEYGSIGATGLGVISNQGVGSDLNMNCNGRIEYSQELWMMGYQTFMNPDSIKAILKNRMYQSEMSQKNAKKFGFAGSRFAIATNELGEELCPQALCKNIHFPTGMVGLKLKNYLMISGDKSMFTSTTGFKLFSDINMYWLSVLEAGYSKFKSAGPSSLFKTVRNSAFNIGLLKENLLALPVLVYYLDVPYTMSEGNYMIKLENISNSIKIPFDSTNNYNPPYDGFNVLSDKIEFPEGIMLRHPLDSKVDLDSGARNVEVYENRLTTNPSPMALSTLFIGSMEAGKLDSSFKTLEQIIAFSNNQFKIWSNESKLWTGSYIPAAASYLDSVLFGMFGLRIRKTGLYMKPELIKSISFMQLSCLRYFDSKIKVTVEKDRGIELELIYKKSGAPILGVKVVHEKNPVVLTDKVIFPLHSYLVIRRIKSKH